jgi:integrase
MSGAEYVDHDPVFARPDGRPWHPERFSRTFIEQVARHGLPPLSVHGLRHSWATLALKAGVHPKVVQERLGPTRPSASLSTSTATSCHRWRPTQPTGSRH